MQQWHPDRWTRTPSLLGEAKRKFQQNQEAYSGKVYIKNWVGFLFESIISYYFIILKMLVSIASLLFTVFALIGGCSVIRPEKTKTVRRWPVRS